MFQLAPTIPDKEILYKSRPKSSVFIKNLPLKLEKPESRRFYEIFVPTQRKLCYDCVKILNHEITFLSKNNGPTWQKWLML